MLLGHDKQKKYFQNVIKNDVLSHAYLFTGQDMIGKKTFAMELFELINNRKSDGDPDFILAGPKLLDGESKIYIEDIRKLKSFFRFKPYLGPYKFAIIDDAHQLTAEAANALLKILEEPPSFSIIILVSSMPGLIPSTILSRCEEVRFGLANEKEVDAHLMSKKVSKEDKDFLVKLAGGRMGLINRLADGGGMADAKNAIDDLRKLFNSGIYEKINYAKKVHEKENYSLLVDYWTHWVSAHLRSSPRNEKIVRGLLSLSSIISQPQYNHRLALENFLINL